MDRVDFFLPIRSQYGVLHHFTRKLAEAMERQGIRCRLHDPAEGEGILRHLLQDPPDLTCAFNGLLPDEHGAFLADRLGIPHLAILVDRPYYFLPLLKSPYTITACDDSVNRQFLADLGAASSLFMPHAVDKGLFHYHDNERPLDIVMLGTHIDHEALAEEWRHRFPAEVRVAIKEAAERVLSDCDLPCLEAVSQSVGEHEAARPHLLEVLEQVELFVRGKDRCDLVRALEGFKVHVYGNVREGGSWDSMTRGCRHLDLHGPVPFEEATQVMRKAKIVLNSCPPIRYGAHERIFTGMACGALVLTDENPWMRQAFTEGVDVAFYRNPRLAELPDLVTAYLESDGLRHAVAAAGQENVRTHHTWDHRVQQVIREVEPIIRSLRTPGETL